MPKYLVGTPRAWGRVRAQTSGTGAHACPDRAGRARPGHAGGWETSSGRTASVRLALRAPAPTSPGGCCSRRPSPGWAPAPGPHLSLWPGRSRCQRPGAPLSGTERQGAGAGPGPARRAEVRRFLPAGAARDGAGRPGRGRGLALTDGSRDLWARPPRPGLPGAPLPGGRWRPQPPISRVSPAALRGRAWLSQRLVAGGSAAPPPRPSATLRGRPPSAPGTALEDGWGRRSVAACRAPAGGAGAGLRRRPPSGRLPRSPPRPPKARGGGAAPAAPRGPGVGRGARPSARNAAPGAARRERASLRRARGQGLAALGLRGRAARCAGGAGSELPGPSASAGPAAGARGAGTCRPPVMEKKVSRSSSSTNV